MNENDFASLLMSEERKKWHNPQKMLNDLGVDENISSADLGCGPGFFTIPLAERLGNSATAYAVDQSAAMLAHLEKNLRAALSPESFHRVKIIHADVNRTGIPDKSVSLIIFAQLLHDLEDHKAFFNEIKRISKEGGKIVDIDWQKRDTDGMGPPLEIRLSEDKSRKIMGENDFQVVYALNAGPHHYGLVAKRKS